MPVGFVREEIRFYGPSGRMVWRWGPEIRRMAGMFDLTTEVDGVEDAVFDETGTFVASFIVDEQILGEIEVPVYVQVAPTKLPKDVEDGFRKSDVVWIGTDAHGRRNDPVVVRLQGRQALRARRSANPAPRSRRSPARTTRREFVLVTRRKGRDTSLDEFTAAPRKLEGAEWEQAAKLLVDRRRSRVGPPEDSLKRWRTTSDIYELTPNVPATV